LSRLNEIKEIDKKKRTIALKAKANKDEDSQSDSSSQIDSHDNNLSLLVRKFGKFTKRGKCKKQFPNKKFVKKNEASTLNSTITCFECGKPGHIKVYHPLLQEKLEKKNKKEKKGIRAYSAWEDNDMESITSFNDNKEVANLCLMAKHESDKTNLEILFRYPNSFGSF